MGSCAMLVSKKNKIIITVSTGFSTLTFSDYNMNIISKH